MHCTFCMSSYTIPLCCIMSSEKIGLVGDKEIIVIFKRESFRIDDNFCLVNWTETGM